MTDKLGLDSLVAYVDGELSAAEMLRVEEGLKDDAKAQRTVEDLRAGGYLLRAAFDEVEIGAPSAALKNAVEDLLDDAVASEAPTPRPVSAGWKSWFSWRQAGPSFAAVLVAVLVGYLAADWRSEQRLADLLAIQQQDQQLLQQAVAEALEKRLSGEAVSWTNPGSGHYGEVTPVRTFKNQNGQWCREYRQVLVANDMNEERSGIACRSASGDWTPRLRILDKS